MLVKTSYDGVNTAYNWSKVSDPVILHTELRLLQESFCFLVKATYSSVFTVKVNFDYALPNRVLMNEIRLVNVNNKHSIGKHKFL